MGVCASRPVCLYVTKQNPVNKRPGGRTKATVCQHRASAFELVADKSPRSMALPITSAPLIATPRGLSGAPTDGLYGAQKSGSLGGGTNHSTLAPATTHTPPAEGLPVVQHLLLSVRTCEVLQRRSVAPPGRCGRIPKARQSITSASGFLHGAGFSAGPQPQKSLTMSLFAGIFGKGFPGEACQVFHASSLAAACLTAEHASEMLSISAGYPERKGGMDRLLGMAHGPQSCHRSVIRSDSMAQYTNTATLEGTGSPIRLPIAGKDSCRRCVRRTCPPRGRRTPEIDNSHSYRPCHSVRRTCKPFGTTTSCGHT